MQRSSKKINIPLYYSVAACVLSFLFLPRKTSANIFDVRQVTGLGEGGGAGFGSSGSSLSGLNFSGDSFGGVVRELFRISVVLTIVLAVIMLTVGGIQYMGSESMFQKDAGRKRIMAAIGGLLIAVLSIFILNIIIGTGTGGGELDVGDSFN
jgi:hypothetical protein